MNRTRSKRLLFAGVALLVVLGLRWSRADRDSAVSPATTRSDAPDATAPKSKSLPPLDVHHLAGELNSPAHDIRADLRIVQSVLETYRSNFLREGNPVGNNREITATLTGDNRLRLALVAPTHAAINRDGELCDRWGTPFHFHAESGTQMEIRSAGPDRKYFTDDDAVLSP